MYLYKNGGGGLDWKLYKFTVLQGLEQ